MWKGEPMEILILLAILAIWTVRRVCVLPRFGAKTLMSGPRGPSSARVDDGQTESGARENEVATHNWMPGRGESRARPTSRKGPRYPAPSAMNPAWRNDRKAPRSNRRDRSHRRAPHRLFLASGGARAPRW